MIQVQAIKTIDTAMLTRRTTFRLYPSSEQEQKLFDARRLHCYLYNACVHDRKTSYQKLGKSVGYFDQQNRLPAFKEEWPEFRQLGSHSLQATVKRVDFAFNRFFGGLAKYPKFKSIKHYSGWTYPDRDNWTAESEGVNGYLELRDLGVRIQMRGKARDWGKPTTCTILFRNGKWYASITVNCVEVKPIETGIGAIGIDLGVKTAITIAHDDGTYEHIENPRFIKRSAKIHKKRSKRLRRKQAPNRKKKIKASRRWRKARKQLSRLESRIARQRRDWQHQTTTQLVSGNSLVGAEKLNTKGMTRKAKKGKRKRQKAGLNRNILDVGFGGISKMLKYKLSASDGFYIECPTRSVKPTQRCPECWKTTKHKLSERNYVCKHCGFTADRDEKSALVNLIYARGLERPSLDADGKALLKFPVNTGEFKQLAQMKRQKHRNQLHSEASGNSALLVKRRAV